VAEIAWREHRAGDVDEVLADLRDADRAEIEAGGLDPRQALEHGLAASTVGWTATVDGEAAFVCGACPLEGADGIGVPWMLGTNLARRHAKAFIRQSPAYIARMLHEYPRLFNAVHAPNRDAIRWLKATGFVIGGPVPHPVTGEVFLPFTMEVSSV
jgi:hypothetical protein